MLDLLSLLSFGQGGWGSALLMGALVTITLALCCVPIGLPLGLLVAVGARSKRRLPRAASTVFSTVFRGLPELLTLLLVYYGAQIGIEHLLQKIGYQSEFRINAFVAAVVAFSLVLAAFSSEVWLGAFKTIPKGQQEAAQSLGLSRRTTFLRVTLPQLMRVALPGLSNNWLTLLKDSSLVSTISLADLMRQTNLAVAATKQPMLFYFVACLLYLLLSALSGVVFSRAERRFGRHYEGAR
ncbi:polar amino acid transport system permease protein [Kerstersia gyiorum]|uniref:ABC transporter permease n=1 Tax=Kerstersia gyiorum TaxID=206506 RepID=UPI0020A1EEEA|nr:ABC transporter permease subunit [Kerstersia gyiorum]MCP1635726.1 polar amino acid transport system permease protein [Kerstersia gyiorum]